MLRALELAIGSTEVGKDVGVREDVGDGLVSFFGLSFRNIDGVFMLEDVFMAEGFMPKDADGERSTVAILKSLFGRCAETNKATVVEL